MKTKYLVRFLNRVAHYDADLELVDVFASASKAAKLHSPGGGSIYDLVVPSKHPRLAKRSASDGSRARAIIHLKKTLHSSFIKDLYEDVLQYMADLLAGAAQKGLDPDRLVGEHKMTITVNEILSCGSWDSVVAMASRSVFRALENMRSTLKLLDSIDGKLGLGVDTDIRNAALPYLELRHVLVHADGVPDADLCDRYPALGGQPGKNLTLTYDLVCAARGAVYDLVQHFDKLVVAGAVCPDVDTQG